ncbi:hypothetical protein T02_1629 [Trichinella nativa]|uniref:Uncharacterized protein n=1 Tax=Trichinella nativa TaxID=6335 RepID=A0A0V1LP06_9BILA|nr:hypothetical protein T02_1629 [Trichinella nativa]
MTSRKFNTKPVDTESLDMAHHTATHPLFSGDWLSSTLNNVCNNNFRTLTLMFQSETNDRPNSQGQLAYAWFTSECFST